MNLRVEKQGGIIGVITVMLLAIVVMLVLVLSIQISITGVNDALNQSDSVAALFLAESGLENASQRLSTGTAACDASLATTVSGIGLGGFNVQSGLNSGYDEVTTLSATQCRVRVTGAISASNVSHTIEAIVQTGSGAGLLAWREVVE